MLSPCHAPYTKHHPPSTSKLRPPPYRSPTQLGPTRLASPTHLDSQDLGVQLPRLVGGDTSSNNRSRDTTRATQRRLARQKHIGDVLVFAQERKVENNLDRLHIGSHYDEFADTSVERFGGFIGTAWLAIFLCSGGERTTHPFLSCL